MHEPLLTYKLLCISRDNSSIYVSRKNDIYILSLSILSRFPMTFSDRFDCFCEHSICSLLRRLMLTDTLTDPYYRKYFHVMKHLTEPYMLIHQVYHQVKCSTNQEQVVQFRFIHSTQVN